MNNVTLIGNLGKDPELTKTGSGISVTRFSVAVNRPYKNGGEKVVDWIDCEAWRQTADFIAKYFHKGDSIGVVGALNINKWDDKDGNKRQRMFVNVASAEFVGRKDPSKDSYEGYVPQPSANDPGAFHDLPDNGELPF